MARMCRAEVFDPNDVAVAHVLAALSDVVF